MSAPHTQKCTCKRVSSPQSTSIYAYTHASGVHCAPVVSRYKKDSRAATTLPSCSRSRSSAFFLSTSNSVAMMPTSSWLILTAASARSLHVHMPAYNQLRPRSVLMCRLPCAAGIGDQHQRAAWKNARHERLQRWQLWPQPVSGPPPFALLLLAGLLCCCKRRHGVLRFAGVQRLLLLHL
jgi:hypothetical protein